MGTLYSTIYQKALFRIKDYSLAELSEEEVSRILNFYLNSAISDFSPLCKENLKQSPDAPESFEDELSAEVQEILALGISFYWLSAQVLNEDVLRNSLSTKDYTYFSPANLLREMQTLRDEVRKEYRQKMYIYTYRQGDIGTLSVESF